GSEREAGQRAQYGIRAYDLLGLRPGAVDHYQGDGATRRAPYDVDRLRSRIQEGRGPSGIGQRSGKLPRALPVDSHVELRVRKAQAGHLRGSDCYVAFARMLEKNDACRGFDRGQMTAVANARGSHAAEAHGACLEIDG